LSERSPLRSPSSQPTGVTHSRDGPRRGHYPDYVEQVGAAADTALLYYEHHGFKLPLADTAGPDSKPDIYIDNLPAGVFGLTGVILSTLFRRAGERKRITLIVTSGHLNGVDYQVGYAAVGRGGKLPGWIAF
jgi:hypothetical protein